MHLESAELHGYAYNMTTIAAIRRANLKRLLEEVGGERGAAAELARLSGVKAPIISQLRRPTFYPDGRERAMGSNVARQLEKAMGKPLGWMDQDHEVGARSIEEAEFIRTFRALAPHQQNALAALASTMVKDSSPPPGDTTEGKNLAH